MSDPRIEDVLAGKAALQTEIERLRALNDELQEENQHRLEMLQRQKAEVERLAVERNHIERQLHQCDADRIKAETEIARLKAERNNTKLMLNDIIAGHIPR